MDVQGGSWKTFLYNTILARNRSQRKISIAVASSGIAAELLAGVRTAHSMFKIPIPIQETSTCNVGKQSNAAKLIQDASIIIWDEAPMVYKYVLNVLIELFVISWTVKIPSEVKLPYKVVTSDRFCRW